MESTTAASAAPATEHTPFTLPPLNDDLREILGRPNFACMQMATLLRSAGQEIARKAEHEQAAVLYWMLTHYAARGADWWTEARAELQALIDTRRAAEFIGSAT